MAEELTNISDAQLKSKGRITRSTALIVDKSQSMSAAIEISKGIGSMISTIVEGDFFCWVADVMASQIKCKSNSLDEWKNAMKMVRAGSATSCGGGIQALRKNNQRVEQIIMVTDQGENRQPLFVNEMLEYKKQFGIMPRIVFVNCGRWSCTKLQAECDRNNIEYEKYGGYAKGGKF